MLKQPLNEKSDRSFGLGFLVILISICCVAIYFDFIGNLLSKITSEECVAAKETLIILGGINVSCQTMTPTQLANWYSSSASVLVIIFLILAFMFQTLQLANQRHEFSKNKSIANNMFEAQRNWEKSKLATEKFLSIKSILNDYILDPPNCLKNEIPNSTENSSELFGYLDKLILAKEEDFSNSQDTKKKFNGDMVALKQYAKVLSLLIQVDDVLKYVAIDKKDKEVISRIAN